MNATPSSVIKGIFALQLLIGVALVAGDMTAGLPTWASEPRAPDLDQPVRPGDQTRQFQPQDLPDVPNRAFPPTTDMPERLMLSDVELDGRAMLRMVGTIATGDGERIASILADRFETEDAPEALLLHSPGGSVGDALVLGRTLRDLGVATEIAPGDLYSPGGSVGDALVLGRTLRDLGVATEIAPGDLCLSACPYLFAGGKSRIVQEGGSLGVHQHYFGENIVQPAFLAVEDIQRGQGLVMAYLDEMGLDPLLIQHALMTPPESIYIFVAEELGRYGIVTAPEGAADASAL